MHKPPETSPVVAESAGPPTSPPVPEEVAGPLPGANPSGTPDPYLAVIERAARDPTIDIVKFQQLMTMRERVEDRLAKQAFDNAIALAKGELGPIVKNRQVDFETAKGRTRYRYEDFAAVASAVDPVLASHGLSYRFRSDQQGPRLKVTCRVSHHDGYGEETSLEANNDTSGNKNDIQAVGSAATYLQRYTLKLALGLAAASDTDARKEDDPTIDIDQLAFIEQQLRDTESDVARFLKHVGAPSLEALTVKQYRNGLEQIEVKKREAAAKAAAAEAAAKAATP